MAQVKFEVSVTAEIVGGRLVIGGGLANAGSTAHPFVALYLRSGGVTVARLVGPRTWDAPAGSKATWQEMGPGIPTSIEAGTYTVAGYAYGSPGSNCESEAETKPFTVEPMPK